MDNKLLNKVNLYTHSALTPTQKSSYAANNYYSIFVTMKKITNLTKLATFVKLTRRTKDM